MANMNPSAEVFVPRDGTVLNPNAVVFGPSQRQSLVSNEQGESFVHGQDGVGRVGYDEPLSSMEVFDVGHGAIWVQQPQQYQQDHQYQQYQQPTNQDYMYYHDDQVQQSVGSAGYYHDHYQYIQSPYQETQEHPLGRMQREKSQQEKTQGRDQLYVRQNGHPENATGSVQHFFPGTYYQGPANFGTDQYGRALDVHGNYNHAMTSMAGAPVTYFYNGLGHKNNRHARPSVKSERGGKKQNRRYKGNKRGGGRYQGEALELGEQKHIAEQMNMLSLNGEKSTSSKKQEHGIGRQQNVWFQNGGKPNSYKKQRAKSEKARVAAPQDAILLNGEGPKALKETVLPQRERDNKSEGEQVKKAKDTVTPLQEQTNASRGEQPKKTKQNEHNNEENNEMSAEEPAQVAWEEEMEGMVAQEEGGNAASRW